MYIIGDRRIENRRESDQRNEHFKGVLILAFIMTLLVGVAFGYYLAAAEAAQTVLANQ